MEGFVIKCSFCQQTPQEVVETNCCSDIFCWTCILEKKICKCGSVINIEKVAVVQELQDILDQNSIDNCKHVGCQFSANKIEMRDHVNNCGYRMVPCPSNPKCGTFLYSNLDLHSSICPYSLATCELCERSDIRQYLDRHVCPEAFVDCICGEKVKNRYILSHTESFCSETQILCPYSKYGCQYKDTRSNVNIHLNDFQNEHLQILDSFTFSKDNEIRKLKAEINAPLAHQICNISQQVLSNIVTIVPESSIIRRAKYVLDTTTKETLFKILIFFFLATLLPMKYFFFRFIFTVIVMRKVWVSLFGPAIRSARLNYRNSFVFFEQMIYLALFLGLTILCAIYSKFL